MLPGCHTSDSDRGDVLGQISYQVLLFLNLEICGGWTTLTF